MSAVEFVSVAEWNAWTDRAINAPNYSIADDPRCVYGWGGCVHRFGHGCDRPLGHPGRCMQNDGYRELPCETKQRPKDWDAKGRAEANR